MDARGVGAVAKIHSAVCRARNKDAPVEAICRAPIAAKLQAEGFRDRSAHDAAELVGGVVAGGRLELALEVVAGLSRRNHERAGGRDYDEKRSEEHTSELQSLMRISYAVFCLKKKNKPTQNNTQNKN